jgi:AAA+ superfamily predicted ATPase
MSDAFVFDDYSDEDLLWILRKKAEKDQLSIDFDVAKFAVKTLSEQRRLPNFGNAGAINNILSRAVQNMQSRLADCGSSAAERADARLEKEDFLSEEKKAALSIDVDSLFEGLIGCHAVKEHIKTFISTIKFSRKLGRDPLDDLDLNFVFSGSPGTGKTTVARIMGQILTSLNLLGRTDVVECSASDFITGYLGQAGEKTRELFKSALGGVLFIDEAYRLNPGKVPGYMQEVVDEIVQILTEKEFKNKMAVIFAGYEKDMAELFEVNPGLKSRIHSTIKFDDFSLEDSSAFLIRLLKERNLTLTQEAEHNLTIKLQKYQAAPHWSNGRDVETLAKCIYQEQGKAVQECDNEEVCNRVTNPVLEKAIAECIKKKGKKVITINYPISFFILDYKRI